jgi:hypothetical protein
MSEMGLHDPFGHLKHKLWPKDGLGVKLAIWLPTTKSSSRAGGVQHIVEKFSTRATNFLHTSFQSEVCMQSYGPPKSRESQLWEFRDSQLGVPGQNVIWMLVSWLGIKYIVRGKVVVSPKSELWWVLWVQVCPWFVLAPKVLQLCTNQLIVWFCASPCEWVSACHSS